MTDTPPPAEWIPARLTELRAKHAMWSAVFCRDPDDEHGGTGLALVHIQWHIDDLEKLLLQLSQ